MSRPGRGSSLRRGCRRRERWRGPASHKASAAERNANDPNSWGKAGRNEDLPCRLGQEASSSTVTAALRVVQSGEAAPEMIEISEAARSRWIFERSLREETTLPACLQRGP